MREAEKRPHTLTVRLEETLSSQIRCGVYSPGSSLPSQAKIAAEFGVSTTVVREAISRLNAAGLVETRQGVGSIVLELSPYRFDLNPVSRATLDDVLEMLEFRTTLEVEAAGLAAARRSDTHVVEMGAILERFEAARTAGADTVGPDFDFHMKIAEASDNHYFVDMMRRLGTATIPRVRLVASGNDPNVLRRVGKYHHDIYEAIRGRDPEMARTMMRMHLSVSRDRLRRARDAGLVRSSSPAKGHGSDGKPDSSSADPHGASASARAVSGQEHPPFLA